jgi:hypothetical protein
MRWGRPSLTLRVVNNVLYCGQSNVEGLRPAGEPGTGASARRLMFLSEPGPSALRLMF